MASYSIWYGMVYGMAWYMVWPEGHVMVYGMDSRAWHDIKYDLAGMPSVWYDLADMVYGMAWYITFMVC